MKILALNSSPRSGGQSKTELMLKSLVEGMREAGAEVEVVDLREKTGQKLCRLLQLLDQDAGHLHPQGRYDPGVVSQMAGIRFGCLRFTTVSFHCQCRDEDIH